VSGVINESVYQMRRRLGFPGCRYYSYWNGAVKEWSSGHAKQQRG